MAEMKMKALASTACKIADALGISLDDLRGGTEDGTDS